MNHNWHLVGYFKESKQTHLKKKERYLMRQDNTIQYTKFRSTLER